MSQTGTFPQDPETTSVSVMLPVSSLTTWVTWFHEAGHSLPDGPFESPLGSLTPSTLLLIDGSTANLSIHVRKLNTQWNCQMPLGPEVKSWLRLPLRWEEPVRHGCQSQCVPMPSPTYK